MQGILMDRNVAIWRKAATTGGFSDTQIYKSIRCAVIPISAFDQLVSFARESTHIIWVEYWVALRKEDQIRDGQRPLDAEGDVVQQFVYVINGVKDFRLGIPQKAYYARELD